MKKIILLLLALALAGCAKFTLLQVRLDVGSFITPDLRAYTLPTLPAGTSAFIRLPDGTTTDMDGALLDSGNFVSFKIIERMIGDIAFSFSGDASNTAAVQIQMDVYIGPKTTTDLYQAQYNVASVNANISPGSSVPVLLPFDTDTGTAAQKNALVNLKTDGAIRYGIEIKFVSVASSNISYKLERAKFAIEGYPLNAF